MRAAVPMYILTRKIKAMGIKVVLSGEGADEAFGGYLFFHKAPNPKEFHQCAPAAISPTSASLPRKRHSFCSACPFFKCAVGPDPTLKTKHALWWEFGLQQRRACRETVRLLNRLHQWDVLRANKAPFAWGVETRVPFLDKAFLELVMNTDPADKMVRQFC